MKTSLIENNRSSTPIISNFNISKNVPIDVRFLVSSIDTIDAEIPLKKRYNGLVFFVVNGVINDGTSDVLRGLYYCFTNDLTTPKLLHEYFGEFFIRSIKVSNGDYMDIVNILNTTYSKIGNIIWIDPLNIAVVYDGTKWKYFQGIYNVTTQEEYDTIPDSLLESGRLVLLNSTRKIILSDNTLSDVIISLSELPQALEDNRYYLINGYLYYSIDNSIYQISDKFKIFNITTTIGNIILKHDFNSIYISGFYRIYNNEGNPEENGMVYPMILKTIDLNNIQFESKMISNITVILISKL